MKLYSLSVKEGEFLTSFQTEGLCLLQTHGAPASADRVPWHAARQVRCLCLGTLMFGDLPCEAATVYEDDCCTGNQSQCHTCVCVGGE